MNKKQNNNTSIYAKIFAILALVSLVGVAFYNLVVAKDFIHQNKSINVDVSYGEESITNYTCPGSFLAYGAQAQSANKISQLGQSNIESGSANANTIELNRLFEVEKIATTTSYLYTKSDNTLASPLQIGDVLSEDFSGLDTSLCVEPAYKHWIHANETAKGQVFVYINNPSANNAQIKSQVYSEKGVQTVAGVEKIIVPAKTQKIISLNSWLPESGTSLVYFQSEGAKVSVYSQQSEIDGITPKGYDLNSSIYELSNTQIIPIVKINSESEKVTDASRISIFNSENNIAKTKITLINNSETIDFGTIDIAPKVVNNIDLKGLAPGEYSVFIESDRKISASSLSRFFNQDKIDFATVSSASKINEMEYAYTASSSVESELYYTNYSDSIAEIEIVDQKTQKTISNVSVEAKKMGSIKLNPSNYVFKVKKGELYMAVYSQNSSGASGQQINIIKKFSKKGTLVFDNNEL